MVTPVRTDLVAAALRALADAIEAPGEHRDAEADYYTRDALPPGETSWGALLRRGRAGAYPIVRLGRHAAIRATDYAAWRESKTTKRAAGVSESSRSKLEALGLRVVGGGSR